MGPPVTAALTLVVRGPSVFPFPDVNVHVYAYPADLAGTTDDFAAGPATFQGGVTVTAFQEPTTHTLNVTNVVSEALAGSGDKVAFRFQIGPDTPHAANQAFVNALDANVETKPHLTIRVAAHGDYDGDGDVDMNDFTVFADCLAGPGASPDPTATGATPGDCVAAFDSDGDSDVDLDDFSDFQIVFTGE